MITHFQYLVSYIRKYQLITSKVFLFSINALPVQQNSLQFVEFLLGPLHSFPPHKGLGLSHTLV